MGLVVIWYPLWFSLKFVSGGGDDSDLGPSTRVGQKDMTHMKVEV